MLKKLRRSWLRHPLSYGLDIDSPDSTLRSGEIIPSKPFLSWIVLPRFFARKAVRSISSIGIYFSTLDRIFCTICQDYPPTHGKLKLASLAKLTVRPSHNIIGKIRPIIHQPINLNIDNQTYSYRKKLKRFPKYHMSHDAFSLEFALFQVGVIRGMPQHEGQVNLTSHTLLQ